MIKILCYYKNLLKVDIFFSIFHIVYSVDYKGISEPEYHFLKMDISDKVTVYFDDRIIHLQECEVK